MLIRNEEEKDWLAVYTLNLGAFERTAEAKLVDALREEANPVISLVAEEKTKVVGHIMFTPVTLSHHPALMLMGLAPMAVDPNHQRKGTGTALVQAGLERCTTEGVGAVVVLGYPEFYGRCGFVPSANFNMAFEYEVPTDAFMVQELQIGYLHGKSGQITYHRLFKNLLDKNNSKPISEK